MREFSKFSLVVFLILLLSSCNNNDEDKNNLIPGLKISGDKSFDAFLLAIAVKGSSSCANRLTSSSTFVYTGESYTVCSNESIFSNFKVETTGNYTVTASKGSQTLTSSRCNSRSYTADALLQNGATTLITSNGGSTTSDLNLTAGTTYTVQITGFVNPSNYSCSGSTPSSSSSDASITFKKL